MSYDTFDSKPINCGQKGKGVDWSVLQKYMLQRLGYTPSLSQKLSQDELGKLGFKAAASGLYSQFQGGFDGRIRNDYTEEGMHGVRR